MAKTTFRDIIERTLEKAGVPLSAKEIWEKANEWGTIGDYETTGKTPWATIAAYCYTDINNNGTGSIIIQTSSRPAQFFLRRLEHTINLEKVQQKKEEELAKQEKDERKTKFNERDLHPLLVAFARADQRFKAHLTTIHHEGSNKGKKGQNEWLHPDLVGVYFPFQDYKPETIEVQKSLDLTSIKLFSFEMKIKLDFGNLRQSYFQAVSNSSWANEGYLVVLNFYDDSDFKDEVRRLNNAFGIGVIQLNPKNIFESEMLFPSRISPEIDWDTVNRLASENEDFSSFLKLITEDCKLGKVKSQYDRVYQGEELEQYIANKGF